MSKKKIAAILFILISFIGVLKVTTTLAFFTSNDTVLNGFIAGDIRVEVMEEFTPPTNWNGTSKDKKVQIKNTGKNDCFVRVSIIPRWVDESDKPGAGDVSDKVIRLEFTNLIDSQSLGASWQSNKWIKGSDGFYYYSSILPVDSITTQLLSTVTATVNGSTVDYPEDYSGKQLKVDIKAEAVQITNNAYKTVWANIPQDISQGFDALIN